MRILFLLLFPFSNLILPSFFPLFLLQLHPRLRGDPSISWLMTSVQRKCVTLFYKASITAGGGGGGGGGKGTPSGPLGVSFQALHSCCWAATPSQQHTQKKEVQKKGLLKGVFVLHLNEEKVLIFRLFFKFSTKLFLQCDVNRKIVV